jgi:CRP-like cAMP-binding protein
MNSIVETIKASSLVVGLTDEKIEALAEIARPVELQDQQLITEEGTQSNYLYILKKGTLTVEKNPSDPFILNTLEQPNLFFGEMAIIEAGAHSASIRSQGKSEVLSFHKKDLVSFFLSYPDAQMAIILNMARQLSMRLRDADERFVKLAKSVRQNG